MKQARLPCLLIGSAGRNPSGVHRKARRDPPDHEDGHRRARVSNGPSSGRLWVAKTPSGVKLLAFPRLSEGEREVLPLLCPACGGPMRILSFITDPPVVAILQHLELPHTPPPISPARGPPQGDFLLDQTPAFDPTEAEPVPVFVFDQSLPHEDDH